MAYQVMPDYLRAPLFDMPQDVRMLSLYVFSALAFPTWLLAIHRCIFERSLNRLLCCLGGTVTCFLEPLLMRLLDATHAQNRQQAAYESLGQLVPWHAPIACRFYFGLARDEALLHGWRKILIVALAPIGVIAGTAGACWPVWFDLNSPYGHSVKVFAASLTIVFSLFIAWLAIPLVARKKQENPQAVLERAGT